MVLEALVLLQPLLGHLSPVRVVVAVEQKVVLVERVEQVVVEQVLVTLLLLLELLTLAVVVVALVLSHLGLRRLVALAL